MKRHLLVTGGAGFIGSAFAREALASGFQVTVLDALTYAGAIENLKPIWDEITFVEGNITDQELVSQLLEKTPFSGLINFAAESHVDNSISGPKIFIETNIVGTFTLLEAARKYFVTNKPADFKFIHVSTDEVFGELHNPEDFFRETTPYAPNSPYSASKAASDHLVRAWHRTYGLPAIVTNCSNNYGPRQFPEKLIPRVLTEAIKGNPLPVYGKGLNVRDWIHVEDHARGVLLAFEKGHSGGTYCFGGNSERKNIDVVKTLCRILDEKKPRSDGKSYAEQITFVTDRLGHDLRYAIDDSLAQRELGFKRKYLEFEDGLTETIQWYLDNQPWLDAITEKKK
jgi:dTDP-glucose 4,6-dehydratase